MDRNLALEVVRVTEWAALAASRLMGRGDEKAADQAAVDAMRSALNGLNIQGVVVIGEGERDGAPMLYIGEKVGKGTGPRVDIALDPLEGTTITAKGGPNALALIAMAEEGGFLNAPDVYMDKIAVGGGLPDGAVRCIGGQMQARLLFRNDDEKQRAAKWGIKDLNRKYTMLDLAHGDVMFAATGVTDGSMLRGVRRSASVGSTHSIIMRSKTGTVRVIEATHNFTRKPGLESPG